jgi:hypothetical protein
MFDQNLLSLIMILQVILDVYDPCVMGNTVVSLPTIRVGPCLSKHHTYHYSFCGNTVTIWLTVVGPRH